MEAIIKKDNQLPQVLHMNAGDGYLSYANNSILQKKVILQAKPVLQESVVELYTSCFPECFTFADMGCSSGPNTFLPLWEIIQAIDETSQRLNKKPLVLQVFLNDLPGNDFNSIFRSLPSFQEKLEKETGGRFGPCFVAAMPGSFYGRLFPSNSLHLVHSSFSLHWCSEEPRLPLNKGNIYLVKTSPPGVHKAYLDQFEKDFTAFLRARSEEVVPGGKMVLTCYGREDIGDDSDKYTPSNWEIFGMALNDMVTEGLIEESKLDSFNLPFYAALAEEVRNVIESEGSFKINRFLKFQLTWDASIDDRYKGSMDNYAKAKHWANRMRAATESVVANHFGTDVVDVIFERLFIKLREYVESTTLVYTHHVVSMTKI